MHANRLMPNVYRKKLLAFTIHVGRIYFYLPAFFILSLTDLTCLACSSRFNLIELKVLKIIDRTI